MRNLWLWLSVAAYGACLALLAVLGRPVGDALGMLVMFGILFPFAAWLACLRTPLPTEPAAPRRGEAWLLAGLVVFISAILATKGSLTGLLLPADPDPRLRDAVNVLFKLAIFVGVPLLAWRMAYGVLPSAGRSGMSRARQALVLAGLALALFGVLLAISRGTRELFTPEFSPAQRVAGLALGFLWMSIEAGVVEEVFFRWLLQSRLAALTGSQVSAVALSSVLFGLAHAPGMWLRGAGVAEGLGEAPGPLLAIAYSVTTQGVAGLMFAVLWARARSLPLVIALHGLIDASSNAARFIRTWEL